MEEEPTLGSIPRNNRDIDASSGWVTTKQAARALGVSPRTIRWHIEQGNIDAVPQGEGVKRTWLVSIDSLQAYRNSRQVTGELPRTNRANMEGADIASDIPGNPIRELADRLAEEAARAAEYRVRLELTEQAQSTLEAELAAERVRREQAERERDVLASRLAELEQVPEPPEGDPETVASASTEEGDGVETSLRQEHRPWWRRWFGS